MKWLKNLFRKKQGLTPSEAMAVGYAIAKLETWADELLNAKLQEAVESENYEEAARIRDLMNKK